MLFLVTTQYCEIFRHVAIWRIGYWVIDLTTSFWLDLNLLGNTESKSWIWKCLSDNSENPESILEDTFPYQSESEVET